MGMTQAPKRNQVIASFIQSSCNFQVPEFKSVEKKGKRVHCQSLVGQQEKETDKTSSHQK